MKRSIAPADHPFYRLGYVIGKGLSTPSLPATTPPAPSDPKAPSPAEEPDRAEQEAVERAEGEGLPAVLPAAAAANAPEVRVSSATGLRVAVGGPYPIGISWVPVTDLVEASRVCRQWIEANDVGNSRWSGGTVKRGNVVVARVSYNGRIWNPDGSLLADAGGGS